MQIGRQRIYTSEPIITRENVIDILRKAKTVHDTNATTMQGLDEFEKGNQPILRKKTYRADINVQTCDNVANEITEFKTSFHWGNPITLVQKSKEIDQNITDAIYLLNECYVSGTANVY